MGLISDIVDDFGHDPPPVEEAIEEIGVRIREDVMKGNFDHAKSLVEQNLATLEAGNFNSSLKDSKGRHVRTQEWPSPEEEAQQLTNFVFLELLELVLEDLETIESQLEPPIHIDDPVIGSKTIERGLEGQISDIEDFLNGYTREEVQNLHGEEFEKFYRKAYEKAHLIRIALGTKNTGGPKDAIENDKYRKNYGDYRDNMGALITVKMAERHLEFIQKLAKWEHEKYSLDMDEREKQELEEVKQWLGERFEIIKELDHIIHPFVVSRGAEAGINKEEAFKNPQKSLQRLSKADQVLDQLHELEKKEDSKIKRLEQMIPS